MDLHRDTRSLPWFDDARRDVQYAVRTLGRAPAFTAVAVITLALGIGATTAIFSVANATLLRPLPYKDADRLVRIVENVPAAESPTGNAYRTSEMNQEALLWWRDHTTTLSSIAAILKSAAIASIDGEAVRLTVARVSPSIVTMLDATPVSGRLLTASDARDHVAVLASSAWRRYFSNYPRAIDRTIVIDGVAHRIVGVAGPELATLLPEAEIWTPYVVESSATIRVSLDVVGQLRDGVPLSSASAEANVIGNAFIGAESSSGEPSNRARFEVVRIHDRLVEPVRSGLRVLMALGGLVLLAVCTNLAESAARSRRSPSTRAGDPLVAWSRSCPPDPTDAHGERDVVGGGQRRRNGTGVWRRPAGENAQRDRVAHLVRWEQVPPSQA